MRVMVTGGGGFLGKAIVKMLLEKDHKVSIFSRNRYPEVESWGVKGFQGDLADHNDTFVKAVSDCQAVIHTAAKAGVWGEKSEFYRSNVIATENVINACRKTGIRYLVYTSSPSVVFDGSDHENANETLPYPEKFLAHYPWSKAAGERLVREASSESLRTISLRPHLIWGPEDPHLCPRIIHRAKKGRLRLIGQSDKLVDAVYVDNAAYAHILALAQLQREPSINGEVCFVTNHQPWPLSKIVNHILKAAGLQPIHKRVNEKIAYFAGQTLESIFRILPSQKEPPITRFVARQLATAHYYDPTQSLKLLNYKPIVSMEEGFERLAQSYCKT